MKPRADLNLFLAEKMPGFVPRDSQQKMTELIAKSISTGENALIEAGTGTGKTFAYLLPTLSSDKKVVISTGTKNLQDQLYFQDLPLINESFGRTTALLKGRSNYLCLDRLHKQMSQMNRNQLDTTMEKLVNVYHWSTETKTGDLTEVLDEEDAAGVQRLVTSTVDSCLGHDCQHFDQCHLYRARTRALNADVVVVNHHLFFADQALKEDDLGELLPQADVIVLDEAHQVEEVARNFYGQRFGSGQVLDLVSDVIAEQQAVGLDDPELMEVAAALSQVTKKVVALLKQEEASLLSLIHLDLVEDIDYAMSELISRLAISATRTVGFARCYSRACRLSDVFTMLTEPTDGNDSAHWLELRQQGFVIHLVPLEVSYFLKPLLDDAAKVWLFVSATLATTAAHVESSLEEIDDKTFRHISKAIGFEQGLKARFPSPFDFSRQVTGFVPDVPDPRDSTHTEKLVATMLPLIRSHNGRSLLLFTSHKALLIAANLLSREHDLAMMAQGAAAKSLLIEKFRSTDKAVLLATHSFWEGVDLSGSDLKLLMIDKLPFTSPDDPVFQAKVNRVEASGGNSFFDLSLPKAAVTLKQGFGRLIRRETDQGLFVLGDPRFVSKPYGKVLKKSLPSFLWLNKLPAAIDYLENLS